MYRKDLFPLIEKKLNCYYISLSGNPDLDSKCTINQTSSLQNLLDNIRLSKTESEKISPPTTEKLTLGLLQKIKTLTLSSDNSNLGKKVKTKSVKADITNPGYKFLLR